jgi:hypothetical protein
LGVSVGGLAVANSATDPTVTAFTRAERLLRDQTRTCSKTSRADQACDIDFAVNQAVLFAEIFIELEICPLEA